MNSAKTSPLSKTRAVGGKPGLAA